MSLLLRVARGSLQTSSPFLPSSFLSSSTSLLCPVTTRRSIFTSTITGSLEKTGPVVGAVAEVEHTFSQEDVNQFASLCGDNNPLHCDPTFAKGTMFNGTIVHGIFVSSLFSTLFGRSINGAIYVSQTLNFKRPVHVGVPVIAKMEIISVEDRKKGKLLTCATTCRIKSNNNVDAVLAVEGEAKVLLPSK